MDMDEELRMYKSNNDMSSPDSHKKALRAMFKSGPPKEMGYSIN